MNNTKNLTYEVEGCEYEVDKKGIPINYIDRKYTITQFFDDTTPPTRVFQTASVLDKKDYVNVSGVSLDRIIKEGWKLIELDCKSIKLIISKGFISPSEMKKCLDYFKQFDEKNKK